MLEAARAVGAVPLQADKADKTVAEEQVAGAAEQAVGAAEEQVAGAEAVLVVVKHA